MPDVVHRRLARPARATPGFWLAAILVTGIGLLLRMVNLSHPKETVFDEVYYANEAWDLLQHGVEWNPEDSTPQYVVHPPLGKWMIGLGEQIFGYNSFGWRIAAVVVGVVSILLIVLAARRLFRSTILAATAGLLMSLDGMHFVLSRAALLDIFLMFWIVVGVLLPGAGPRAAPRQVAHACWRPAATPTGRGLGDPLVPAGLRRLARPRLRRQVERPVVRAALRAH